MAGGDAGVVVEDGRPVLLGLVGGDDGRTAFVALTDDLEEQIAAGLAERQVADFVEDQERGGRHTFSIRSRVDAWPVRRGAY